jgi:hypothetical protein
VTRIRMLDDFINVTESGGALHHVQVTDTTSPPATIEVTWTGTHECGLQGG